MCNCWPLWYKQHQLVLDKYFQSCVDGMSIHINGGNIFGDIRTYGMVEYVGGINPHNGCYSIVNEIRFP